jgi:hypothetical protein
MSTRDNGDDRKLPEAARAALHRHGEKFLGQLDAMREEGAERIEIEPLDPQAGLALRQRGDGFLDELAQQRAQHRQLAHRDRRRWLSIAAALIGIGAGAWLLGETFAPKLPPAQTAAAAQPSGKPDIPMQPITSPPIPEPSSALLALAGALVLIVQRRR